MPQKFFGRVTRVAALLMMGLVSTSLVHAQVQQGSAAAASASAVTGRTATVVNVAQSGKSVGVLRKVNGVNWIEFDTSGVAVFKYDEVKRDDSSVHLIDNSRGITLQVDVRARKVTSIDSVTRRREIMYDVQSASATPVPVEAIAASKEFRPVGPLTTRDRATGVSSTVVVEEKPKFCWTDALMRPAGTIPGRVADCPAGYSLSGGSCKRTADSIAAPSRAADCPAGYTNSGNACERAAATKPNSNSRPADCPDGYTNTAGECFRLSAPKPLDASSMTCKGGETKIDSRCFRSCEAGFTSSGANCVRAASSLGADNMTCKAGYQKNAKGRCIAECAAGYTNTGEACTRAADALSVDAMLCKAGETRNGGRCFPATGSCAKGEVLQGGLCYTACAAGYEGVGTACIAAAPKTWAQCGMGAAKDLPACAAMAFDPVGAVKQLALVVGLTGGSGIPQAARLAAMQKKYKELNDAYAKAKEQPALKKARADWEQANSGKDTLLAVDKMSSATTEEDMVRHAAQMIAIVDLVGPIDQGSYPKCAALFPVK
ncbi:hypothetical protein [Massilia sp. CF038]|uniref:hypothetical protein n=1 Tax=Massilia sp. CF038 TaxID=1881045 RepID=UPI0015B424A5|nr:hypothetical protein [Massilia sp. CF038]